MTTDWNGARRSSREQQLQALECRLAKRACAVPAVLAAALLLSSWNSWTARLAAPSPLAGPGTALVASGGAH